MLPSLTIAPLAALALSAAVQEQPHQHPVANACGVVLASAGAPCPAGFVVPPSGWYAGDTHEHIQLCAPGDVSPQALYAEMLSTSLAVSSPLIWGAGFITPDEFKAYLAQFVTGAESPTTASDPSHVIWCGIETSGVSVGNLGHIIGLHVTPAVADLFQLGLGCGPIWPAPGWKNDGSGDYSKPALDLLRQAQGAVTGYAHQAWPVTLYADASLGGWDWEAPSLPAFVGKDARCSFGKDLAFGLPKTCGNTHPVLAPFDVALGRIDFLEAFQLLEPTCGPLEERYFGMVYRLLNAGRRVALSAGTDADCIGLACPPRVYVKLQSGDPFTYGAWTRALAQGRTSIASGPHQFLEIRVHNRDPGDTVPVSKPASGTATVQVKATYRVAITDGTAVTDAIEIVQDGEVVASQAFGPIAAGSHTFQVSVPITKSGWLAARTASLGTHTGAVYVRYDGRPTANCADAEYWTLYADYLELQLDLATAAGPEALAYYAGCSADAIRAYVQQGRRVYAAVRDYDAPAPAGIARIGAPTPPACADPCALVTADTPIAGQPFKLRWFDAPAGALGGILISTAASPVGVPLLGARLHVLPHPAFAPVPATSDEGGYGEFLAPSLPPVPGATVFAQAVWFNPPGCDAAAMLSSSDALGITLQP